MGNRNDLRKKKIEIEAYVNHILFVVFKGVGK